MRARQVFDFYGTQPHASYLDTQDGTQRGLDERMFLEQIDQRLTGKLDEGAIGQSDEGNAKAERISGIHVVVDPFRSFNNLHGLFHVDAVTRGRINDCHTTRDDDIETGDDVTPFLQDDICRLFANQPDGGLLREKNQSERGKQRAGDITSELQRIQQSEEEKEVADKTTASSGRKERTSSAKSVRRIYSENIF